MYVLASRVLQYDKSKIHADVKNYEYTVCQYIQGLSQITRTAKFQVGYRICVETRSRLNVGLVSVIKMLRKSSPSLPGRIAVREVGYDDQCVPRSSKRVAPGICEDSVALQVWYYSTIFWSSRTVLYFVGHYTSSTRVQVQIL